MQSNAKTMTRLNALKLLFTQSKHAQKFHVIHANDGEKTPARIEQLTKGFK